MKQNVVEANRERDLWLTDGQNVHFIPQGWCDSWSVAANHCGGLDSVEDELDESGQPVPRPEIHCYVPTHACVNSPVDTLFVAVTELQELTETTEADARKLHPALADYLDKINAGESV